MGFVWLERARLFDFIIIVQSLRKETEFVKGSYCIAYYVLYTVGMCTSRGLRADVVEEGKGVSGLTVCVCVHK